MFYIVHWTFVEPAIEVDPSKLDASNKTQLEPLVDLLKHDKQYKEAGTWQGR